MNMVEILKRDVPVAKEDSNGDFLFGGEYIYDMASSDLEENEILLLCHIALYAPTALIKLGCFSSTSINKFIDKIVYADPFTSNGLNFLGLYPLAILSKDIKKYRIEGFIGSYYDLAWDTKWTKAWGCSKYDKDGNKVTAIPLDQISQAYLGHGYTDYTSPSDGSNSIVQVKVKLSNEDWLVCATWEWYNK